MSSTDIVVRGARQHNLRNVDVTFPRDKLVVITGPSGSGKSSLAFDTLYAEGQRRYVESLSAYARQFLDRLPKPDVDLIDGLSPAIAIQQQAPARNPRSTVGTITEIYDYLRLLFARVGEPHCPECGRVIDAQTPQQMVDRILALPEGTRFAVLAPVVRDRKGQHDAELARFRKEGYVRARIDGELRDLGEAIALDKNKRHTIEIFVDRLSVKADVRQRLTDSIELALRLSGGLVVVAPAEGEEMRMSERFACPEHGISLPELTPRLFSFNSPAGACPDCGGLGEISRFEPDLVVPDPSLSIRDGAVAAWGPAGGAFHRHMLKALETETSADLDVPWRDLPEEHRALLMNGGAWPAAKKASTKKAGKKKQKAEPEADAEPARTFEGILPGLERRAREYERRKREEGEGAERAIEYLEERMGQFASRVRCGACGGARLRREALAVRIAGVNVRDVAAMSVKHADAFFRALELDGRRKTIAEPIVREVTSRLRFLVDVGLDYLSLDRAAATLSGGESERIRLATQIGAGLVGVLYVLDEPSIGLHPRDNARLLGTLFALRDRGNTVVVVEHDGDTILAADYIVDMGPGAGKHGGRVVSAGTPVEVARDPASVTGAYLSGRRAIPIPKTRRKPKSGVLRVRGARAHNLGGVDVDFPLGLFTCVTGVSGSGKSSLVVDTLLEAALQRVAGARGEPVAGTVEGLEQLDKVVPIDQAPIGRTPRSNPATYTGVFGDLRELFATLPEARARGYGAGRFSFNVKGGRCEACEGAGLVRVEMHFLPDVFVTCEECGGRRYNRETLEVRYRGHDIADVLAMPVDDARELLSAFPRTREKLDALHAVGLGYVELGQSAITLSGGEAQRVKLARELARRATGQTLYVLDEPTTGLHASDVEQLVAVLHELVDAGNTVIVIEHDADVMKVADYVIDMGPEGGDGGGRVVATGTPEEIARSPRSHTAPFLAKALGDRVSGGREARA